MSDQLPRLEIHPAYFFDCEECGREVFVRGELIHKSILLDQISEQYQDIAAEFFLLNGEYAVVEPEIVQCHHEDCQAIFEVIFPELP